MTDIQTVFLTGITGHLGHHVAQELIAQGYGVRALVRTMPDTFMKGVDYVHGDLAFPESYRQVLHSCQATIHTAAAVSFGGKADHHMAVNFQGTLALVAAAEQGKHKRFVFVSSRGTHKSTNPPESADEALGFIAPEDADGYMHAKLLAEQAVHAAGHHGPLETVTVSPTALMGGLDHKPGPAGALVRDFLNGKAKFYLDGGINVVDVHGAAKATVNALTQGQNGETYFLGGTNVTMNDIYAEIAAQSGLSAPTLKMPTFVAYSAGMAFAVLEKLTGRPAPVTPKKVVSFKNRHSYCSAQKAHEALGLPQTPLSETIKETIDFFKS